MRFKRIQLKFSFCSVNLALTVTLVPGWLAKMAGRKVERSDREIG